MMALLTIQAEKSVQSMFFNDGAFAYNCPLLGEKTKYYTRAAAAPSKPYLLFSYGR